MRLTRSFLLAAVVVAALAASGCGQTGRPASAGAGPPSCARTFIAAITSPDPMPGVWDCLTTSYQDRLQGQGDAVFAVDVPLWSGYRYIGRDHDIALFDLTVNGRVQPAVYDPPVAHVVMAVYLDPRGRVDHAKAATPS